MTILALDKDDDGIAGGIVYWSLSGTIDYGRLVDELQLRGIEESEAPDLPSPRTALSRAVKDAMHNPFVPGDFVRRHGGAWWSVDAHTDGQGEPQYDPRWGVSLDAVGRPVFHGNPSETTREQVLGSYANEMNSINHTDVSAWLLKTAAACDAVALRPSGGVYFVPRTALPEFMAYADALGAASFCRVYKIPALHSDSAVDAVLDGLIEEVESFVTTTHAQVEAGEHGEAYYRNRSAAAERMTEKVERFEALLGRKLEGLHENLQNLHSAAVAAALAAMPDDEEA